MGDETGQVARLRLIRSANVGPVSYRQLILRFGDAAAALEALPDLARRGGRTVTVAPVAVAERELAATARAGARHLFLGDADYPTMLAELETAPPVLIVRGDTALFRQQAVAMVGARNASAAACRFTRQLSHELSRDVVVVSGLARGIDTAAHVGALDARRTIACIASGIDIAFPPENEALQRRIGEEALLVAEQPPGTEPKARNFPSRNRIIAGLAVGTVVVEAAPRSGSLITARIAADAGREVMAVPGSPLDPRAQGCNALIREGATLVQSAADILEQVRPIDARAVRSPAAEFGAAPPVEVGDRDRDRVTGLLGPVPVPVDELVRQSGLPAAAVQIVLLELELAGRLDRHAGARVSLVG